MAEAQVDSPRSEAARLVEELPKEMEDRSMMMKGAIDHHFFGMGHVHGTVGMQALRSWQEEVATAMYEPGLPTVPIPWMPDVYVYWSFTYRSMPVIECNNSPVS
jgi:hypothetical protein